MDISRHKPYNYIIRRLCRLSMPFVKTAVIEDIKAE